MKSAYSIAFTLGLALLSAAASAEDLLQWQQTDAAYRYGKTNKVTPEIEQVFTIEQSSGWSFGDLYWFVDNSYFNGASDPIAGHFTYYAEFSPRLSFNKIFDKKFSFGPITDVLLAATQEFGEGQVETALLGVGVDLAVPGFDFFQLNIYHRDPSGDRDGDTWQITPAWGATFPFAGSELLFDGYIDWIPDNDETFHANFHLATQLKYDIGRFVEFEPRKLYVGLGYDYAKNKYGVKDGDFGIDADQSVLQFVARYNF
ncbi:outer membrane protein OmpK [Pseudomonas sp. GV071]|uniref:outer membrane protein OmpK n=1 Tax=Pseudomonas sp. GV071 TaxID=2135754 RepID=UPI000D3A1462|nr:outer membrane protein OmpK [Pseudomonas sp. GV071]PTQ74314.1 nucleoside-specific outer membrane channel protein Tsx [Pseudomonas sp. GV071]